MGFLGGLWSGMLMILSFFWDLFTSWLFIFISPIDNFDALWILIPIYLSWIFTEFFQEKDRTSFGNAISNGVVPLWAGIDWTRYLVRTIQQEHVPFSWALVLKFAICGFILMYGLAIIIEGIRAKAFVHYFGRIREVTYAMIMFTPIVYGIIPLTWKYLLGIVLFFPAFYYAIEWIDVKTPEPESLREDQGDRLD